MRKSPSPGYIASITAALVAVLCSLIVFAFTHQWISLLISLITTYAVSFFTFYYLLQQFIYRKIKLIYKNIYRYKTQNPKITELLQKDVQDPIEEVRKEVVDWMKQNQEELNLLKEQATFRREFLGNVSHELKTPIQSIQGYIHTLLDGALDDKKVNYKFLSKAGKSADRLVDLVDDLTSISEFESSDVKLHLQDFDIKELVEEVFDVVEHLAKERDLSLSFHNQADRSFIVEADRKKIQQVLVNLIVNAIKYGNKKGEVVIGFYDLDLNILIEVSDNGEGIEQEYLPRLFERFYRTDGSRSREQGGTGLGLSIVKHILEAHKQTVNVRSEKGAGSTFGFTLKKGT